MGEDEGYLLLKSIKEFILIKRGKGSIVFTMVGTKEYGRAAKAPHHELLPDLDRVLSLGPC